MSKNIPPQLPPSPPPAMAIPASAGSVFEYVMAFDKPLTVEEKTAWLMLVVHYIQSGFLPESIYPTLCNKIASLPEILPAPNRPPEKIPGSDYIHPGPPKPYQVLLKMYDGNKPVYFQDNPKIVPYNKNKENGSSLTVLICASLFILLGLTAYGIGSWRMKSMDDLVENTESVFINDERLDNPFENIEDFVLDNPFSDDAITTLGRV